MRTSFQLVRN